MLEHGKVKTTAKSGDIAAMDVVIPSRQHWAAARTSNQPAKLSWFAYKNRVRQRLGQQRHAGSQKRRTNQRAISRCALKTGHKSR